MKSPLDMLRKAVDGDRAALNVIDNMSMAQAEALDREMGCRASRWHCRKTMDLGPVPGCSCDGCALTAHSLFIVALCLLLGMAGAFTLWSARR